MTMELLNILKQKYVNNLPIYLIRKEGLLVHKEDVSMIKAFLDMPTNYHSESMLACFLIK